MYNQKELIVKKSGSSWFYNHPKFNPFKIFQPGFFGLLTSPFRISPDFLIIGAPKCGTSSLYYYLIQHPSVLPAKDKEVYFFDENYEMGILWYKSYFSTIFKKYFHKGSKGKKIITGEANPNYLHHPLAHIRISNSIPEVKLIVILRNPVDRAYSDHQMKIKNKWETLSFEEAIKSEQERLVGEKEKIIKKKNYLSYNYTVYSYLSRGLYFDQLKEWYDHFKKEQFLIISTDDFENKPSQIMNQVFQFLDLSPFNMKFIEKKNVGSYSKMNSETRQWLIEYFKPYNEKLYKFLEREFQWDK